MKKLFVGLFIFVSLTVAVKVQAITLNEALSQIKNLKNEITQLKSQLKGSVIDSGLPSVTTSIANIDWGNFTINFNISSPTYLTSYGYCLKKGSESFICNPIRGFTSTENKSITIVSLSPSTSYTYYVYATNSLGKSVTPEQSFTTIAEPITTNVSQTVTPVYMAPRVSIYLDAAEITSTSATNWSQLTSDGYPTVTAADRGICYGTSPSPTFCVASSTPKTSTGDPFYTKMTGLQPDTLYYYRAYARNAAGTAYSSDRTFRTLSETVSIPVDGVWSAWFNSGGCVNGFQTKIRTCIPPTNGGSDCVGSSTQQISCSNVSDITPINISTPTPVIKLTPINGGWTSWSNSGTCVSGLQTQIRSCTNPSPANGGASCVGVSMQQVKCIEIGTKDSIACHLKINGLCYNSSFLKIINNTAQTENYNPDSAIVITSEPTNQPKSYTLNSLVKRKFYINNNSYNPINIQVKALFYPVAIIEYGKHSMSAIEQNLPIQTISLKEKETKEVYFTIPTNQQTLSANIQILLTSVDDPNRGISYSYYSQPFSIYNPSDTTTICQGFTIPNWANYLCTNDVFVPLGSIGCKSTDIPPSGKQCISNHWYPSLQRDRSAENIKMLAVNVYLTDDKDIISSYEKTVSNTFLNLLNKINKIKSNTGNPKTINIDQKKCIINRDYLLSQITTSDYQTIANDLLSFCGFSRLNYTHTFLNFYPNLNDSDQLLINNKIWMSAPSKGRYLWDGIFISQITSADDWQVILHEMMHSFGAPDLYTENYVYGSTYIWGDCHLMKGDIFDQDTSLCPMESSYWGLNGASSIVSTPPAPILPTSIVNTTNNISPGTRTLKVGIKGDDVRKLQEFLKITTDGSFGPQTRAKVMEWQAQNGLKVDGLFGSQSAQKAGLSN